MPTINKKLSPKRFKGLVQKKKQKDRLAFFGKIEMIPSYDYKRERRDR
ncbi:MAG: hypothetical protein Q7J70_02405 [Thermodesulfovibrionales bacterium]|nr:hypothetical protein [Thermodesulfovibrionales bacterium]